MGKGRGQGAVEVRALEAVEGGSSGLDGLEGDGSAGTVRGMGVLSSLSVASYREQLEVLDGPCGLRRRQWSAPLSPWRSRGVAFTAVPRPFLLSLGGGAAMEGRLSNGGSVAEEFRQTFSSLVSARLLETPPHMQ